MTGDREFELAATLCRLVWSGRGAEQGRALANGIDLERLVALAARHRIEAIVETGMKQAGLSRPPFRSDMSLLSAQEHLKAVAESARLADALTRRAIDHLFVKGVTLATLAWPQPALKMSADIDLLVAPRDLALAAEVLDACGYRLAEPGDRSSIVRWHRRCKESLWVRSGSMQVDLHTALVDVGSLLAAPIMTSPRQLVAVAPGIALPTLSDELLYAYLCVHGAWSSWFRLKWLADLAAWLARRPGQIGHLHATAVKLGAGRASAQALLLIDRLFGDGGPSDLIDTLASLAINQRLRDRALAELYAPQEPLDRRFGTWRLHAGQLMLLPGLVPKGRELARQISDTIGRRTG